MSAWVEIVAQVVAARDLGDIYRSKTPGGAGTHTGHTDTRTHGHTDHTDVYGTGLKNGTLRARSTPVALTLPQSSPATDMFFTYVFPHTVF